MWMLSSARAACLLAALSALPSCASTNRARSVEQSGFLGDYSQLEAGPEDRALLVYRNEAADYSRYERVLLDPVVAYAVEGGDLEELDPDEVQALLDYFDAALRDSLGAEFPLADAPGPDTVRLRVALTEAEGSAPLRDLSSTVMPAGRALSTLKRALTGAHMAVGKAQMELLITDSVTGATLGATVDARVGTKSPAGILSTWNDAKRAMDLWAERLTARLVEAKGGAR